MTISNSRKCIRAGHKFFPSIVWNSIVLSDMPIWRMLITLSSLRACACARARSEIAKLTEERGDKGEREIRKRDRAMINFQGLSDETVWFSLDQRPKDEDGMAERSNTSSTSSLTLPPLLGTSPDGGASPRRAVSPLLEVRRPHCTLNCESCNIFLEDIYRHSMCCLFATATRI